MAVAPSAKEAASVSPTGHCEQFAWPAGDVSAVGLSRGCPDARRLGCRPSFRASRTVRQKTIADADHAGHSCAVAAVAGGAEGGLPGCPDRAVVLRSFGQRSK